MILGMGTGTYTLIHVLISLLGIASGLVVLFGLISGKMLAVWNTTFLMSTAATSLTGFGFPFHHLLPSHVVGIISLLVLSIAIAARYIRHLEGAWRRRYVICASIALYLNVFVAIVQVFAKVPALKHLAPTQTEIPFVLAQLSVLGIFVSLGIVATRRTSSLVPQYSKSGLQDL